MQKTLYLNGEFLPSEKARINVMDRGFLFADSVYEVTAVLNGKLIDNEGHLTRLQSSLNEIKINYQVDVQKFIEIQQQLIQKNNLNEGLIYIQITRGVEDERDFGYGKNLIPTILFFTQEKNIINNSQRKTGIKAITTPDLRWKRCDIKSTALLAQVIAKNIAKEQGAAEALMYDEKGFITEGSSSNAYIVKNGKIITRNLSNEILHGITRRTILEIASNHSLQIEERPFSIQEAYEANECFITSATTIVIPIIEIDGRKIANGCAGEVSESLFNEYISKFLL